VRAELETAVQIQYVAPKDVKALINDKGYVFLDIRTPEEHAEGAKRYFKNVPFAYETEQGPRLNNKWKPYFEHQFPNKMSRVIIGCDDGTERSEMAYEIVAELGYTSVKVVDGGILALLEVDPLDSKDKAPKWRLTGQTSGVRYAYNDGDLGEFDDSA